MARQNVATAFTELTAELSASGTTLVVASTALFPAVPFTVTLLPASTSATYEQIEIDSSTSATTMVCSGLSKRYLTGGSSSGSGLTWPIGTRVRLDASKNLIDNIYTEIDAVTTTANAALPKAGGTMSGEINSADNLITRGKFKDGSAVFVDKGSVSGAQTLDYTAGHVFQITATGSTSYTVTNWPASGTFGAVIVGLHQDGTGSRAYTHDAAVDWPNANTAPTLGTAASDRNWVYLFTVDGGTNVFGVLLGADY